jgi:protein involved in polysaccharide export with SLBB domain
MRCCWVARVVVIGSSLLPRGSAAVEPEKPAAPLAPPEPASTPPIDPERRALEGAIVPEGYVLGPGDRLRIDLWGLQSIRDEIDVGLDGTLLVARVGLFQAAGRTLAALRADVERRLAAAYPSLRHSVSLVRPRTFLVHVTGAVARPGTYAATPLMRVSGLMPLAGGALPEASTRGIVIQRRGAPPSKADLLRFTRFGDPAGDPTVLDGDTVFVPPHSLAVEIGGAVRLPGRYELIATRDLTELLELAGGPNAESARTLPARLTTRSGDRLVVRNVALDAAVELHDGDRVHVPALSELGRTVVVEGAVVGPPGLMQAQQPLRSDEPHADASPRELSVPIAFVEGDRVSDLVAKSGGLQPWADARSSYLLRPQPDGHRRTIPVDLAAITARARPDVEVQPGDTLVVPSRREAILVSGAVLRPGLYQFRKELKPSDYVALAGGPTRSGDVADARTLSRNGESRRIAAVEQIDPGAAITVPERRFTAGEIISLTLILANLAVSAAALGVAASR